MDDEDDLLERVEELESTVAALREELREPPRGPLGIPRPPTPREALRFADEYAIPAAIAVLEANVRVLELLQRALRASRGAGDAAELRSRASDLSRESLDRLDRALDELSAALSDADLPENPEARALLEEVRELNDEVRGRLEPSTDGDEVDETTDGTRTEGLESDDAVEIDVEAELDSIREEVRGEEGDAAEGETADDEDDDQNAE